jgi:benzaldehyde dehydrogenase (NAD)
MSLVDTKQFERRIFNGKWVAAAAGVPVREPATGAILFESGLAGKGEIAAAAKVARAA